MKQKALIIILLGICFNASAQRNMENLGRGLVAIRKSNSEVFVSWRIPVSEYKDSANYNLYRDNTLIGSNISVSNYVDQTESNGTYQVAPVINGIEQIKSSAVKVSSYKHGDNSLACIKVPIQNIPGYETRAVWVGDIDGNHEYDFVLAKMPTVEGNHILVEAYTRKGEYLWRYDCGPNSLNRDNIEPGSSTLLCGHGDNITVYDINKDGFAEVIIRTANGVVFGDGQELKEENNDKQFISVLEGTTGREIGRSEVPADFISDGPLNGHMGIAYLDGVNPSVVWSAKNRRDDKAFNMLVSTWDWKNDSLILNWKFNRETSGLNLPDGHNIRIIDVDSDGNDEITPMCYTLDEDGSVLYTLGDQDVYHGDRFFIGDMDPTHGGLEGYGIQQGYSTTGIIWYYYDAKTGEIMQKQLEDPIVGNDYARGYVGDMDPRKPYYEFYTFTDGLYNVDGTKVTSSKPDSYPNLRIWWDGDLLSEMLDNKKMTKWDYIADIDNHEIRLYTFRDVIQDPRKSPAFYGDILGDWREEAVYAASDGSSILIFTTTDITDIRLYSLSQNPGYRNCLTVRGYYQGHMLDYYLGEDMEMPNPPDINILGKDEKLNLPNGLYSIQSLYSKMYLDTVSGISQQKGNDQLGQIWKLIKHNNDYRIYSMALQNYLGYSADTIGSDVFLTDSVNSGLFRITESDNATFTISPASNNTVVITAYDTNSSDATFKLVTIANTDMEKFHFHLTGNYFDCNNDWKAGASYDKCNECVGGNTGYLPCSDIALIKYKILHKETGKYLTAGDTEVFLSDESNSDSQVWRVGKPGGYVFINESAQKYLNYESTQEGSSVFLDSKPNKFRLESQSDNYFLKPLGVKDLCLQINNSDQIILGKASINDNNAFKFETYIPTSIEEKYKGAEIDIFPNPAKDKVTVKLPDFMEGCIISLKNQIGQDTIIETTNNNVFDLNISDLAPGIYFLNVITDNSYQHFRLIKR